MIDPIFGRPLNFFLFTLPAWQLISGWLLTLAIIVCVLAVVFILITGGAGAFASAAAISSFPGAGFPLHLRFCC